MNPATPSLQERFAASSRCFGCGPANGQGLRIRSFPSPSQPGENLSGPADAAHSAAASLGDEVIAEWHAEPHHEAFPGMLNGGIIGSLLDCHSNWTAAWLLMNQSGAEHPPCTVTADYAVKLRRPTLTDGPIYLAARVVEAGADRATVEAELTAGGKVCATCRGTFVAVKEGHPAFHRW